MSNEQTETASRACGLTGGGRGGRMIDGGFAAAQLRINTPSFGSKKLSPFVSLWAHRKESQRSKATVGFGVSLSPRPSCCLSFYLHVQPALSLWSAANEQEPRAAKETASGYALRLGESEQACIQLGSIYRSGRWQCRALPVSPDIVCLGPILPELS